MNKIKKYILKGFFKKNEFYIKLSGNLWNNSILFKKRKRDSSF